MLLRLFSAGAQQPTTVSAPVLRIAAEGAGRPLIGRVTHAVRMRDGSLVVADDAEYTLHWFDAAGRFRFTRGREGAGPGEFRSIRWMSTCAQDSLYVYDAMQDRVAVYASDGRYVRQRSAIGFVNIEACAPDGTMVGITFTTTSAPGSVQRGAIIALRASNQIDTLQTNTVLSQNIPLGVRLRIAVGREANGRPIVVYGVGDSAQLTVRSLDRPPATRAIGVGVANRIPTTAQYDAAVDYWATRIPGTSAEQDVMRAYMRRLPKATQLPAYAALLVDPATRLLWVQRSHAGDGETVLERRTLAGALQGLVRLPADVTVFDVRDGYLVGRVSDATSGEEAVVVYRLAGGR
jgi:hypothetical protein